VLSLLAIALAATSTPTVESGGLERRFGLEGSLFLPVNDGFGAARDLGYGAAVSASLHGSFASFGLQFALHFGPGERTARYVDLGTSLGVLLTPIDGPVTPVFGGGLGVRYISVRGAADEVELGTVIRTHYRTAPSDSTFGAGAQARGGVLFFKDGPMQMSLIGEYTAVFTDGTPQAFVISFGVSA
jgi:hypothetical protein